MLTTNWQADIVIYETFLFMPIYFVILMAILYMRLRKSSFRTHYYTLVISQGAADFLTVILFGIQMLPRYFHIGNQFIFGLDAYGASNAWVNSGPQMFILRSVGVFLITMQRYVTICRHHGTLHYMFQATPFYAVILAHWLISFLLHLPAVLVCHSHFEDSQAFFVFSSEEHRRTSAAIVITTFLFCGLSTLYMYSCIIRMLCSTKRTSVVTVSVMQNRQSRRQESRVCIHVFFLTVISIVTFSYYVFQVIYSNELDVGNVGSEFPQSVSSSLQQDYLRALRKWYPLVSGNMSFINPLMLIFLNRDIQKIFTNFFNMKNTEIRTSSIMAVNRSRTN